MISEIDNRVILITDSVVATQLSWEDNHWYNHNTYCAMFDINHRDRMNRWRSKHHFTHKEVVTDFHLCWFNAGPTSQTVEQHWPLSSQDSRLLCMFKILNELVEIPINDRLIPADRRTRGGHNQAYKHIRANTTLGQNSFWHRTISDWNSLPAAATESKTVAAFKSQLVD